MNETGPLDSPRDEPIESPRGRSLEKENPVPPPVFWIKAITRSPAKIESMESSIGTTKHAESCAPGRPAFTSVGELGRKSRSRIIRQNASEVSCTRLDGTPLRSAPATCQATR